MTLYHNVRWTTTRYFSSLILPPTTPRLLATEVVPSSPGSASRRKQNLNGIRDGNGDDDLSVSFRRALPLPSMRRKLCSVLLPSLFEPLLDSHIFSYFFFNFCRWINKMQRRFLNLPVLDNQRQPSHDETGRSRLCSSLSFGSAKGALLLLA